MNRTIYQNWPGRTKNWTNLYLEPHDYRIYYVNIDLRHQYGISVAELQTFLLANFSDLSRWWARRNVCRSQAKILSTTGLYCTTADSWSCDFMWERKLKTQLTWWLLHHGSNDLLMRPSQGNKYGHFVSESRPCSCQRGTLGDCQHRNNTEFKKNKQTPHHH